MTQEIKNNQNTPNKKKSPTLKYLPDKIYNFYIFDEIAYSHKQNALINEEIIRKLIKEGKFTLEEIKSYQLDSLKEENLDSFLKDLPFKKEDFLICNSSELGGRGTYVYKKGDFYMNINLQHKGDFSLMLSIISDNPKKVEPIFTLSRVDSHLGGDILFYFFPPASVFCASMSITYRSEDLFGLSSDMREIIGCIKNCLLSNDTKNIREPIKKFIQAVKKYSIFLKAHERSPEENRIREKVEAKFPSVRSQAVFRDKGYFNRIFDRPRDALEVINKLNGVSHTRQNLLVIIIQFLKYTQSVSKESLSSSEFINDFMHELLYLQFCFYSSENKPQKWRATKSSYDVIKDCLGPTIYLRYEKIFDLSQMETEEEQDRAYYELRGSVTDEDLIRELNDVMVEANSALQALPPLKEKAYSPEEKKLCDKVEAKFPSVRPGPVARDVNYFSRFRNECPQDAFEVICKTYWGLESLEDYMGDYFAYLVKFRNMSKEALLSPAFIENLVNELVYLKFYFVQDTESKEWKATVSSRSLLINSCFCDKKKTWKELEEERANVTNEALKIQLMHLIYKAYDNEFSRFETLKEPGSKDISPLFGGRRIVRSSSNASGSEPSYSSSSFSFSTPISSLKFSSSGSENNFSSSSSSGSSNRGESASSQLSCSSTSSRMSL